MAVCYSQASYARDRLLSVLKRVKAGHCLQQQDRLQIKCLIEEAKLAIGHKIEQMQDDFRQFPDPDISERYDREADPEDSA